MHALEHGTDAGVILSPEVVRDYCMLAKSYRWHCGIHTREVH
jgi:hypothetical protein